MSRPVVFNHIPKTAGTALTNALVAALDAVRIRTGMDPYVLGPFVDLDVLGAAARRLVAAGPEELPEQVDLVAGHFTPTTTRARYPGARDLTVLREPRTRLLSQWLFTRAHTDRELRQWPGYADLIRASRDPLVDYLADPGNAAHTDNLMVRFLTWPHDAAPPDRFISPRDADRLLEAARQTLSGFSHADALEAPGFVPRLSRWLGTEVRLETRNAMPHIPPDLRPDVEAEARGPAADLLIERNVLDTALWTGLLATTEPTLASDQVAERAFSGAIQRYDERLAEPPPPGQGLPRLVSRKVRRRVRQWRATQR